MKRPALSCAAGHRRQPGGSWPPARGIRRPYPGRSGTVLLIVTVVVLLAGLAAYGFLLNMQTEYAAVRMEGRRMLARHAAASACDTLRAVLELPPAERLEWGGLQDNPLLFGPQAVAAEDMISWNAPDDVPRAWMVPPGSDPRAGPLRWGVVDESSKLHLGRVLEWEQREAGAGRTALMAIPGMDESTADALLDWMDADDQQRVMGAEGDFYATAAPGFVPLNTVPWSLDQLLWIRGIDHRRLWGAAAAPTPPAAGLPGSLTPGVAGSDDGRGRLTGGGLTSSGGPSSGGPSSGREGIRQQLSWAQGADAANVPWAEVFTIYSAERNTSWEGTPRIDVNQPDLRVLHQQLSELLPVELANYIVLYRQYFSESSSAAPQSMSAGEVVVDFDVPPSVTLQSLWELVGSAIVIGAEGEPDESQRVESPLTTDTNDLRQQLAPLLNSVTTVTQPRIVGRVSVNTASAAVLSAVPGVDGALAERIVATRDSVDPELRQQREPLWLLTEGLVDVETYRSLSEDVCSWGDVVQGEFWGFVQPRAPMYCFQAILDASGSTVRQVVYRQTTIRNSSAWQAMLLSAAANGQLPNGR